MTVTYSVQKRASWKALLRPQSELIRAFVDGTAARGHLGVSMNNKLGILIRFMLDKF